MTMTFPRWITLCVVLFLLLTICTAMPSDCTDVSNWVQHCNDTITANKCDKEYYKTNCRKTCGLCTRSVADCADTWPTQCKEISAGIRKCDEYQYQENCKKTCGLCGNADCTDVIQNCIILKDVCHEHWVRKGCRRTCRLCTDSKDMEETSEEETATHTASEAAADSRSDPRTGGTGESQSSSVDPQVCLRASPGGNCSLPKTAWYYEPLEGQCRTFMYGGCHDDINNNHFQTEENCNRYCRADDICQQPNGARNCKQPQSRYYYNSDANECLEYSGCDVSLNNFISLEACQRKCGPEPSAGKTREACSLGRHAGVTCTDRFTARNTYWYYDSKSGRCQPFTYTGCGGNENRFNTEQDCTALCSMSVNTTPTPQADWGEWSPWTECNATCGSGSRTQSRTCMPPGGRCQGSNTNTITCNLQACCVPQDGTWSDWNDWSPCSRSCGRGSRTRQGTCSAHNECGRPCAGSNTQNQDCNTQACPSAPRITVRPNTQPFSAGDNVTFTCRSTNTGGAPDGLSWSFFPGNIGREQRAPDSIELHISNLSLEHDGIHLTCLDRGGAEEKQTSVVLRVDQKAVLGVCKASANSGNWTIAGLCDVTKVYDSSGQYQCVWQEENDRYYNYPPYSIRSFWQMSSSDGRKLQKGNCSFWANIPASFLRGSRYIKKLKFRANIGPGSTLSDYVTVPVAYPETPTVTCLGKYRIDLPEGAPFECTCQTNSLGTPVGRLLLKVKGQLEATGSVGQTSIRLSRNIRPEDNNARVTCLVDWAENVNGSYELPLFVLGYAAWGEWDNWSACSATCGHGTQSRLRTCYPTRSTCQGSNTGTLSCKLADCCDVLPSTSRLRVASSPLRANHTVRITDRVNFKCDINPVSCSTLQLNKIAGSEVQIVSNKTRSSPLSLDLTVTRCEDAGIYYCLAENNMGQTNSSTAHLHVHCAPRLISSTEMTTEVVEGSDGQLSFDLVAYPLPTVDTFTYQTENSTSPSQQEPIRSDLLSGRCEGRAYALHLVTCKVDITGAALNDGGLYSLQVRNAEGQQSFTFRLHVTPQETNSSNSLSFIGIAIAVLVLAFIAASVVFIIKRRRGATKESTGNERNVYDTAPPGVNAEEPTYCNVTTQSVTSACASDNNIYINIENNTSTKDSSEPGTSKGPDEDTQNVLYATVDKSRKPSSADNTEKPAKPAVMPKPMRKGAAGRKSQENGGDGLSANTTATTQAGGVENVVDNNEAGSRDSQKATANEEGLFYTEVDFSQYRPETQRPLPQQEETFYAAVDLQKTAALRT